MSSVTTVQEILDNPRTAYPHATVACFDPTLGELPRRQLDRERLAQFLQRLEKAGADAVLIGASTGQGHLRSPKELNEWFEAATSAGLQRTTLMGLLRPEDGETELKRQATTMANTGYAVGFVRPGSDLASFASDAEVANNMMPAVQALADAGLAVGLYSIPDVSGLPLSVAAVEQILDSSYGSKIVAVKVTEADYEASTLKFLQADSLAHLKIVQGWDPHLARALQEGQALDEQDPHPGHRVGVTSGPMSFAIYQYLHLLEAAKRQDWDEVKASQAAVTSLFEAMQDDPQRFADLQRAKFIMGLGHPLLSEVTEPQTARVLEALRALPRAEDRERLARSLNLMEDGPFHRELVEPTQPV